MSCIFCQIIQREAPADIVYEDEQVIAFYDIRPQAPVHVLVVPKRHIPTFHDLPPEGELLAALVKAAQEVAQREKIEEGYLLVVNCGAQAGQTVYHLHIHVLGGRPMRWPPG